MTTAADSARSHVLPKVPLSLLKPTERERVSCVNIVCEAGEIISVLTVSLAASSSS